MFEFFVCKMCFVIFFPQPRQVRRQLRLRDPTKHSSLTFQFIAFAFFSKIMRAEWIILRDLSKN